MAVGNSSGEAFEARFVNLGGGRVQIATEGLVVEPLKKEAQEQLRKRMAQLAARNPVTARLNAYCLEFLRRPPSANSMFRIADSELQQRFAPMRDVLKASRRLRDLGVLSPDSDPTEYFHSIRQWSFWTMESGFDERSFGTAFLERVKKNFEAARQPWNGQVEQTIRSLVPNRWKDVQKVLEEVAARPTKE